MRQHHGFTAIRLFVASGTVVIALLLLLMLGVLAQPVSARPELSKNVDNLVSVSHVEYNGLGNSRGSLFKTLRAPEDNPSVEVVAVPTELSVGDSSRLTVTLVSSPNIPWAGKIITFATSSDLGSGSFDPTTDTTDVDGKSYSMLSSTLPGPKQIVITVTKDLTESVVVTFITGTPTTVSVQVGSGTLSVDETVNVTATIRNEHAALMPGETITFGVWSDIGSGGFDPLTDTTDADGAATSVMSSTQLGTKRVVVTTTNGITNHVDVTFTAGAPNGVT
ncbi:MAG: hypothetical protein JXA42_13260, partial [Anaerolineales bacterium]|nr:hypothetical protein [Anaerolineales bacterium]